MNTFLLLRYVHSIRNITDTKLTDLHESCTMCPVPYCCLQIRGSFTKFNFAACNTLVIMPWQKLQRNSFQTFYIEPPLNKNVLKFE